jgi:hypothetical protein
MVSTSPLAASKDTSVRLVETSQAKRLHQVVALVQVDTSTSIVSDAFSLISSSLGCGGCCDVRRATIIVNIVGITMGFIGLITIGVYSGVASTLDAENYDDDEMKAAINDMDGAVSGESIAVIITVAVIRLLMNAAGIWGALKYNQYAVGVSLLAYAAQCLMSLVFFNIVGLVVNGFFAYPHVFLIKEIRSGIMTPETYEAEKQSCCCV